MSGAHKTTGGSAASACDEMFCTPGDVARVLCISAQDAGHLIVEGSLPSVVIPGLGRRVRASDLREYIRSLPADEQRG